MTVVLRTRALRAGYGDVPAVRDLDLELRAGEVVALVGPNGAGKTTTLLTVSGAIPRLGGEVEVLGEPVDGEGPHRVARRGVAFVPEDRGIFFQLTVAENLRLRTSHAGGETLDGVLERFPALRPLMRRRAGLLSGGEQQMLALAGALLSNPRVLLVDELSHGLAPVIVEQLLPLLRAVADERGTSVLLVEQQVPAALAVADRAYVLSRGRLVASGPARDLAQESHLLTASYLGEAAEDGA